MNKRLYIFFVLINIVLAGYYTDLWHNANTVSRLLPVKTLVEDGTWRIDEYHEQTIDKALINGHYYSEKAPLPALIVLPMYYAAFHTGLIKKSPGDDGLFVLGSLLIGTVPFILIVLLVYHSMIRSGWNVNKAMLVSLLAAYSTFIFAYAGTSFSHVMAALWLLLSYIYIKEKKNFVAAGFFAGLCFITEYPTGLILFLWPLLLFLDLKKVNPVLKFYAGTLPAITLQLVYNYCFTGSPFDMLYNHQAIDFYHDPNTFIGFALPIPVAMWKLLFGFYRGLFFHAPILILILVMMINEAIKTPRSALKNYVLLLFIASYLLFSSYRVWYGGWCFGPRHFVPVAALMIYVYSNRIDFNRWKGFIFFIIASFGIIYTWMDKCTLQYSINADLPNTLFDVIIPAFREGNFNPNNVLTQWLNVSPGVAAVFWLMMFCAIAGYYVYKWKLNSPFQLRTDQKITKST